MTEKRQPAQGSGGFGVVSTFGSLDGWALGEAVDFLSNHPKLKRTSITENGYRRYQFDDNSELWIRPDGQIIRLPHTLYNVDGRRMRGIRVTITGKVMHSGVWHNLPRDEHEWVVIDDSAN